MTTFHILSTPGDIYQIVLGYFPTTQVALTVDPNDAIKMVLQIPDIIPFSLTNSVMRKGLIQEIEKVVLKMQIDSRCQITDNTYSLDLDSITLKNPLSDWQSLQRMLYEKNGHRCIDVLMGYLNNLADKETLISLGLAPTQLENPTKGEISYFREVIEKCYCMPEQQRRRVIINLKILYPLIYEKILDELCEKQLQKQEGVSDVYHETLQQLNKAVVGQPKAVELLASLLTSQMNTSKNQVFLFVGPTGVGKTELAKAVAKTKDDRLITFSMNQYPNETDVTRFFGAGTGYVGSTDKPHLAKELDKLRPTSQSTERSEEYLVDNAVVLFDEFEKASPLIKQGLLTLFDEFYCIVAYTKEGQNVSIKYTFQRCVFISTSNLYQAQIFNAFHQKLSVEEISNLFKECNKSSMLSNYSPELLARMYVVPFGPISRGDCYQSLIKMKLDAFFETLKKEFSFKEVSVADFPSVLSILENKLYGNGTNIRNISQYFFKITNIIHQNRLGWGTLEKVKLVLFAEQGGLKIKLFTFIDLFEVYREIDSGIELP